MRGFGQQGGAAIGQRLSPFEPAAIGMQARQPRRQRTRHQQGRELAGGRQQPLVRWRWPLAGLVEFAQHARAHVVAPVVEHFLELVLDDLALFFDDQDFLQPGGEAARAVCLQRPGHADLVDTQAQRRRGCRVDAQIVHRLAEIEPGLAAGHQAQARAWAVVHDAVQAVGARVGGGGVDLVGLHPMFLRQHGVGPADMHPVRGQLEVSRYAHLHARRVDLHRGRALDNIGAELERHPTARVARHGPAVQAEVEDLLHAGRRQHRYGAGREDMFALMRQRRRTRRVVVAGHHQHAAGRAGAGKVGMLEDVATAVHAGALAVPHREDAVALGTRQQVQLLRAPDGGGGEVFVDAGAEAHVVLGQKAPGLVQGGIQAAQG